MREEDVRRMVMTGGRMSHSLSTPRGQTQLFGAQLCWPSDCFLSNPRLQLPSPLALHFLWSYRLLQHAGLLAERQFPSRVWHRGTDRALLPTLMSGRVILASGAETAHT